MKKLIRLTESDLHRIVKESVKKILKEDSGEADVLLKFGAKEIAPTADTSELLSERGANIIKNGGYVFNWVIEIKDGTFCSRHNFKTEFEAERNCDKYLKEIGYNIGAEAYVESIFNDDETGELTSDTMLVYSDETGWMD